MQLQDNPLGEMQSMQSEAVAASKVRRPRNKPGVLVVDDEDLVRSVLKRGLERNGFDVWEASDGREAIDYYRAHNEEISVVLLDVRMPGMDGPQTLAVLHDLDPDVPVCFMSADTGEYEPDELLERGAAYFIAKPFHLEHLANVLWLLAHGASGDLLASKWEMACPIPRGTCMGQMHD
jgi:CheY-like chemotaxis protein